MCEMSAVCLILSGGEHNHLRIQRHTADVPSHNELAVIFAVTGCWLGHAQKCRLVGGVCDDKMSGTSGWMVTFF